MTRAGLQCAQLLCALGLGLSLGILYDLYRVFIKKNHGRVWCLFGDLLWWLVALGWSFFLLVRISWAELRIPIVLAVFAGMIVYLYYFSPVLAEIYKKAAALVENVCRRLFGILAAALKMLFLPLVLVSGWSYRLVCGLSAGLLGLGGRMVRLAGKKKQKQHAKRTAKKQCAAKKRNKSSNKKMFKNRQRSRNKNKNKRRIRSRRNRCKN